MFKLVISDDEGKTTVVPLSRDELSIGRKEGNTVRLTERNVSRSHARITRRDAEFVLEDLGSYTGTSVNGRRLEGLHVLASEDRVGIGDYELRFETAAAEALANEPTIRTAIKTPARLVMLVGPAPGAEYALARLPLRIGRGEDVEAHVNHRSISREHADVVADERGLRVRDLGSSNGLRVNGTEVPSAVLEDGDVVELGQVKFRFVAEGGDYVFDADEVARMLAAETNRTGALSKSYIGAAIAVFAVVAVVGIAVVKGRERSFDPLEAQALAEARTAEAVRDAIRACQDAVARGAWTDAVGQADRALALDGSNAEVHGCRVAAASGADAQAKFDVGVAALALEDLDKAFRAFESIAPGSKLREEAVVETARQRYVQQKLGLARDAAMTDPERASELARALLEVRDLTEAERREAEGLAGVPTEARLDEVREDAALISTQGIDLDAQRGGPENRLERARACEQQGDWVCVREVLEGAPPTSAALYLQVRAAQQTGDRTSAKRFAAMFAERFPTDARTERLRAQWGLGARN